MRLTSGERNNPYPCPRGLDSGARCRGYAFARIRSAWGICGKHALHSRGRGPGALPARPRIQ
eukprot:5222014-Pyramimonas_sp.AAC.1